MEQLYLRFFNALPIRSVGSDEDLHLLNADELAWVRRTEQWAMAAGVLTELVAYPVIFLPIQAFPALFETRGLELGGPFPAVNTPVLWVRDGWMLLVTLVELYLLWLANLAAVHGIAVATGYIRREARALHAGGLVEIALDRRIRGQGEFGMIRLPGCSPGSCIYFCC